MSSRLHLMKFMPRTDPSIYRRVAQLHVEGINQGFLASLGVSFLSVMYQAIDEGPDSILIVCQNGGQVIGFVAGAVGMRGVYLRMLKRWPKLLVCLTPFVFSASTVRKLSELLVYSADISRRGQMTLRLPDAELLSIAVDANCRGAGHARSLYQQLSAWFVERGCVEFKIVVGEKLDDAHRFYLSMGAEPKGEITVHRGQSSIVYVQPMRTTS